MGLEKARREDTILATGFLVAVTLIHELVHYARNHNNIKEVKGVEAGNDFEKLAFKTYVDDGNAIFYYGPYENSFRHLKALIKDDKNVIPNIHVR